MSFADITCLSKKVVEPEFRKTQSCNATFGLGIDRHHAVLNDGIDEYDLCVNIDCDRDSRNDESPIFEFGVAGNTASFTTRDLSAILHAMKTRDGPTLMTNIKLDISATKC